MDYNINNKKRNLGKGSPFGLNHSREALYLLLLNLNHPQMMMANSWQHLGLEGEHSGRYTKESAALSLDLKQSAAVCFQCWWYK